MSGYFGYGGYGNAYQQNYVAQQQAQAAYVARSYEAYQQNPAAAAAYNTAYRAQMPPPPPPNSTAASSNQIQKYDYSSSSMTQAEASKYYYPNVTNGYDAALYSAANSMMQQQGTTPQQQQQQQQQSQPKWNTANPSNNQTIKKQNFKRRNPPAAQQLFYCEVCKISCAGPQTYKEHLDGQKHKKREQAVKLTQNNPTPVTSISKNGQNIIRCELCDVSCTGRDAYAAHLRGSKHQKTAKLYQKLGKPIPAEVTITQHAPPPAQKSLTSTTNGNIVSISAPPSLITLPAAQKTAQKAMSTPPKVNFVSGSVLKTLTDSSDTTTGATSIPKLFDINTTAFSSQDDGNEAGNDNNPDYVDVDVEPVGREYIEMQPEGKIITFHCKLCDCKFNDPNAKDMHLKGRRHRLAYKKKVDPNLRVDMKNVRKSSVKSRREKQKEREKQKYEERQQKYQNQKNSMMQQQMPMPTNRRFESHDDKHIMAKHLTIYPTTEEINTIQEIVNTCEKALKLVSDEIAAEDTTVTTTVTDTQQQTADVKMDEVTADGQKVEPPKPEIKSLLDDINQPYRTLKGVMRDGLLAKGLLLKGDTDVQLVVLCTEKPTKTLLDRVYTKLVTKIEQTKYSISLDSSKECIHVKTAEPVINCRIYLTSTVVREEIGGEDGNKPEQAVIVKVETPEQSADLLDKQKCLESLASLRHAKWFQARCSTLPSCVITIRILRDLCRRNPTWAILSQWALELLVEKSLSSVTQNLSPGEALRRVLECMSSGILLPNGPGLFDPCEKVPMDASENLKDQQREEITSSAQMALRLLAFKQIHKILGMDEIEMRTSRKRHRDTSETDGACEEKKEKKEDENLNTTPSASTVQPLQSL